VYGEPSAASADIVDAILLDISDNTRIHGVFWMLNPAIGAGTVNYFKSASKKIVTSFKGRKFRLPGAQ